MPMINIAGDARPIILATIDNPGRLDLPETGDITMFYADENKYGLGTSTAIRRFKKAEQIVSAGDLLRFASAAARDAFVAEDPRHRKSLSAAQARKYHATGGLSAAVWADANAYGMGDAAGYDKFIGQRN